MVLAHCTGPLEWSQKSAQLTGALGFSAPFPMALLFAKGGTKFRSGSLTWRRIWLRLFSQAQLITGVRSPQWVPSSGHSSQGFLFQDCTIALFLPECLQTDSLD